MKRIVSLMISVMLIINPLAGVLAEGESAQAPATQTVNVIASDGKDVTQSEEAIDVSGSGYQEGALVNGDGASAALTVENEIQVTSTDGSAKGVEVSSSGEQGSATLNAGGVTTKSEGEDGYDSSVHATSTGEHSNTTVVVENVSSTSTDGTATVVYAYASGDTTTTEVKTGDISSEGKYSVIGIEANSYSGFDEIAGSDNKVLVNAGDVTVTSTDVSAIAVSASASGDTNTTEVTTGDIASEGKHSVTGIEANSDSSDGDNDDSDNKVIVNAENVTVTSTDGNAKAVDAEASGSKNTTEVTTGDITSEGKERASGIVVDSHSDYIYATGEYSGSDNKVIVNAGNVTTTSSNATGVSADVSGNKNTIEITTGKISADGKEGATGIHADSYAAYNFSSDEHVGSDNKIIVDTGNIGTTSTDGYATGVSAHTSRGERNTAEVTTGEISADGKEGAKGIDASSYSDYNYSSGEFTGSENKVLVKAGNVTATSIEEKATAVSADASGDKNIVEVTAGEISADGKEWATGIFAKSDSAPDVLYFRTGSENKAVVNARNVVVNTAKGNATGIDAEAYGLMNTANVTVNNETARGETKANGIVATLDGYNQSFLEIADSNKKTNVQDGDVVVISAEGATGINADATGDRNTVDVAVSDVTAEGKTNVIGINVNSRSGDGYSFSGSYETEYQSKTFPIGGANTTTITAGNVIATSSENEGYGIEAVALGDKNTVDITANNVTVVGKMATIGIEANSASGSKSSVVHENQTEQYSVELEGADNKITVSAVDVNVTSDTSATGIDAFASGDQNIADISANNVIAKGKKRASGINVWSNSGNNITSSWDTDGNSQDLHTVTGANNISIVHAGDVIAKSIEDDATGVNVIASGYRNTADLSVKNITAEGAYYAEGISAVSEPGNDLLFISNGGDEPEGYSETVGSNNRAIVLAGDVKASSVYKGKSVEKISAIGLSGTVSGDGNSVAIITGNITAKALADGGDGSRVIASGVIAENENGGKQTISTGDIDAIAVSKSVLDESQKQGERVKATAIGVEGRAANVNSTLEINAGSVSSTASSEGGLVIQNDGYYNSAVSLAAYDSGNVTFTADGDVVLTLTETITQRDVDTDLENASDNSGRMLEPGTYTGNREGGLLISVIGDESEITAVINGSVHVDGKSKYTAHEGKNHEDSHVSGVIIGDDDVRKLRYEYKTFDEAGNLINDKKEDGSYTNYNSNGNKSSEYDAGTGIYITYREDGTKEFASDSYGNRIEYDENGNEISKSGDLKERSPEVGELGTANVKIEGDITSTGVGLEVVPTLSGGNVNVIVEGTIKGESGAVLVNDNVNAGNFNLTVWKIDPTVYHEYDENDEVEKEEESYLEVMTPGDEGYKNDNAAAEELLKQVQYIIKVDPNITNAHVDLDGTTKFTDFTGEEYDVAHEDDKVVVKISADAGYQITGAFNGEGKEETLLRDSDGNYYIIVPRGGGVYLTATVKGISQGSPEEEREEKSTASRITTKNGGGWVDLFGAESKNHLLIPAVNRLVKSDERKMLAALAPIQQLLVVLINAGFNEVVAASGLILSDEAKQVLDRLTSDLRGAVRILYSWENGVRVKWYYVEMNLPDNVIARFAFRQKADGTWMLKML